MICVKSLNLAQTIARNNDIHPKLIKRRTNPGIKKRTNFENETAGGGLFVAYDKVSDIP